MIFRRADRYLFQELVLPFLICTLVVLAVVANLALPRDAKLDVATFRAVANNIPGYLVLTLPVATALAVSLATNRLARDNEITVLRAAGVPLVRLFLPVFLFGALVGLGDLYLADKIVPNLTQNQDTLASDLQGRTLRLEGARGVSTVSFTGARRMTPARWRLTKVILTESQTAQNGGAMTLTTADSAEYENGIWELQSVVEHRYDAGGNLLAEVSLPTRKDVRPLDLSLAYRTFDLADPLWLRLSFAELSNNAVEAARLGNLDDARRFETERWTKLALPLMALVFAVCAPALSLRFAGKGSFAGLMLTVGVVFVAWNTLLLLKSVGLGGYVPPLVAAWTTDILFLVLGLVLLRTQE